jgi:hypothetical protein
MRYWIFAISYITPIFGHFLLDFSGQFRMPMFKMVHSGISFGSGSHPIGGQPEPVAGHARQHFMG